MPQRLTRRVNYSNFSMKSLRDSLEGAEPPYPVYYFGRIRKVERPEPSGKLYRNIRRNPLPDLPDASTKTGGQDYLSGGDPDYVATED